MRRKIKKGDLVTFTKWIGKYKDGTVWYGPITNWKNLYLEFEVTYVDSYGLWFNPKPIYDYWEDSHHNCAYVNSDWFKYVSTWSPFTAVELVPVPKAIIDSMKKEIGL